jgi:glycosyltransferase involved in cell wall biosynthesis
VVPVYNSEGSLSALVERTRRALSGVRHEIVLVNDGSADGSWEVVRQLCARYPGVRGLNLMRNYGQHNALLAGIRSAAGAVIVTLDDDLQHPPEEIPRLLEALVPGRDVVYGTPRKMPHSLARNLASWLTKVAVQKAMGAETARHVSAFRAFRTSLRDAFETYRSPFVSIDVMLTWGTGRFGTAEVDHRPREVGSSQYTFRNLVRHGLTMVTGFSTLPLRLASLVGFSFTLIGFGVLAFVVARYLARGGSVPGFPFLASIVAIFAGAQLFALGIMGEYLARMHVRLMDRPSYTVAESAGGPAE